MIVKFIICKFSTIITLKKLNFERKLSLNITLKIDKDILKTQIYVLIGKTN